MARAANLSTSSDHVRQQLAQLDNTIGQVMGLVQSVPDPLTSEAKFLRFMTKSGGKLGEHKADLEKQCDMAEATMKKSSDQNLDPNGIVKKARESITDIMQCILLFTLITLIRNPCIRNPQEKDLRESLAGVRQNCNGFSPERGDAWWMDYDSIVDEILGGGGEGDAGDKKPDEEDVEAKGKGRVKSRGKVRSGAGSAKVASASEVIALDAPESGAGTPAAKRRRGK